MWRSDGEALALQTHKKSVTFVLFLMHGDYGRTVLLFSVRSVNKCLILTFVFWLLFVFFFIDCFLFIAQSNGIENNLCVLFLTSKNVGISRPSRGSLTVWLSTSNNGNRTNKLKLKHHKAKALHGMRKYYDESPMML